VSEPLRVYLVDDEPLALSRLGRLIRHSGRARIVGSCGHPEQALVELAALSVDLLLLDIHMPVLDGFALLGQLPAPPPVIFVTAYDRHALQAFGVDAIDYLLKPVEPEALERALAKFERLRGPARAALQAASNSLAAVLRPPVTYPERLAVRLGTKIQLLELSDVTHFAARDKLTYALTVADRRLPVSQTITELEQLLDPGRFVRIHRSTLVNTAYINEVHGWFAGRMLVRLGDGRATELPVARERVGRLREVLGF
jgi:two-component system LytT family response regulator